MITDPFDLPYNIYFFGIFQVYISKLTSIYFMLLQQLYANIKTLLCVLQSHLGVAWWCCRWSCFLVFWWSESPPTPPLETSIYHPTIQPTKQTNKPRLYRLVAYVMNRGMVWLVEHNQTIQTCKPRLVGGHPDRQSAYNWWSRGLC